MFGGLGVKGYKKEIWAFNIEEQVWEYKKFKGKIPSERFYTCYTENQNESEHKWYIFGGITSKGNENDLWVIDIKNEFS